MIRLDTTNREIIVALNNSITTNPIQVVVSYSDDNGITYIGATNTAIVSNTSNVVICPPPTVNVVRNIDSIIIFNDDTSSTETNILFNDNGNYFKLAQSNLQVSDTLQYTHSRGWETIDVNGSLKTSIFNQTATNLTGTPTLPNGVSAITQTPLNDSNLLATTNYVDSAVAAYSAITTTIYQTTINFGSQPLFSGNFTISGTGLTPGSPIMITQAASRPNSILYDSVEMDQITATGIVINSTTIQCNWGCKTAVSNSYTFNYWI